VKIQLPLDTLLELKSNLSKVLPIIIFIYLVSSLTITTIIWLLESRKFTKKKGNFPFPLLSHVKPHVRAAIRKSVLLLTKRGMNRIVAIIMLRATGNFMTAGNIIQKP